jgi:hypothetical protein
MAGFFMVLDVPERRLVRYQRIQDRTNGVGSVVYLEDESVLGKPVDGMPFVDKTGLGVAAGGILFEVPYLPDAGKVYFAVQPEDSEVGAALTATAKAGTAPYTYQWYRDDKQVVNVPESQGELVAGVAGSYWVVVTDAGGEQAVGKAVTVE